MTCVPSRGVLCLPIHCCEVYANLVPSSLARLRCLEFQISRANLVWVGGWVGGSRVQRRGERIVSFRSYTEELRAFPRDAFSIPGRYPAGLSYHGTTRYYYLYDVWPARDSAGRELATTRLNGIFLFQVRDVAATGFDGIVCVEIRPPRYTRGRDQATRLIVTNNKKKNVRTYVLRRFFSFFCFSCRNSGHVEMLKKYPNSSSINSLITYQGQQHVRTYP